MDNCDIELVGSPCGHHGPYTFYKAFKYTKNGTMRILSLSEFFFVKLWNDSDLVCIGELQLLWVDKNSDQMLSSLRLYFLPENTPDGRLDHGADEVVAISEKVVLRVEDLLSWITLDAEWSWGCRAIWECEVPPPPGTECKKDEDDDEEKDPLALPEPKPFVCTRRSAPALTETLLDFSDVEKEKSLLDDSWTKGTGVMVLSYPRYCRYKSLMKRLESVEDKWLRNSLVAALGGFSAPHRNTRVLFCRDTFDYPDLEGHELLCNHLAPKLKGRPRGKRKKRAVSPGGSESNESEVSIVATSVTTTVIRTRLTTSGGRNGLRCNTTTSPRRSGRCVLSAEERAFHAKLNAFLKVRKTTLPKLPSLGHKELDLYQLYARVQQLGGYDKVTGDRLWKCIFKELGGANHGSTSAATVTRRHYERLLLPYERSMRATQSKKDVSRSTAERRRSNHSSSSGKSHKASTSSQHHHHHHQNRETLDRLVGLLPPTYSASSSRSVSTSSAHSSTVVSTSSSSISSLVSLKCVVTPEKMKSEGKTSSLRSVRVKPDRLQKDKKPSTVTSPVVTKTVTSPTIVASASAKPFFSFGASPASSAPATSAATPISPSVNKVSAVVVTADKSTGKENIPVPNVGTITIDDNDEVIEIPYKPKSPEIIDLESEPETTETANVPSAASPVIPEVKKRKLDILKEGGLEVTAVSSTVSKPSVVIGQSIAPVVDWKMGESKKATSFNNSPPIDKTCQAVNRCLQVDKQLSIDRHFLANKGRLSFDKCIAAAASKTCLSIPTFEDYKKSNETKILSVPRRNDIAQSKRQVPPPRVIQSCSIYSHSEKTVYGNPKDLFPTPHLNALIVPKPLTGEVLDLTVKTSQKPVVEIMRIPSVPSVGRGKEPHKQESKQVPVIDGRIVGSNLEITLVQGPKIPQKIVSSNKIRPPQKRSSTGKFMSSKSSTVENGKSQLSVSVSPNSSYRNGNSQADLVIPSPRNSAMTERDDSRKTASTSPDAFRVASAAPTLPNYLSQLSKTSYFPMIDPLLYAALCAQGCYPPQQSPGHAAMTTAVFPPAAPMAEQLRLCKELLNQSRLRFPFPPTLVGPEMSASVTSVGQSQKNESQN